MKTITMFLMLAAATAASGQSKADPRTKLEAFDSQSGAVIVRGFSLEGYVSGVVGGGLVTVQSMEIADATTGKKVYGIAIDVKEGGSLERTNRSFIDLDEIPAFLKGIDYVSKIDKSVTRLNNFQADFHTRGDFEISTFSSTSDNGATRAALSSGSIGRTSVFVTLEGVGRFRDYVARAQETLNSLMGLK